MLPSVGGPPIKLPNSHLTGGHYENLSAVGATALVFRRLAVFITRPSLFKFVPAEAEVQIPAATRFMEWAATLPAASVGFRASGVAELVRSSCYRRREQNLPIGRLLGKLSSNRELKYEAASDREIWGPRLRDSLRALRRCTDPADVCWLPPHVVRLWLDATIRSVESYSSFAEMWPRRQAITRFLGMVDRHRCSLAGALDLPDLYDQVVALAQSVAATNALPIALVSAAFESRPASLPYRIFWTMHPLEFGISKDEIVHLPHLCLWTHLPSDHRLAPPSIADGAEDGPVDASTAAHRLREELLNRVEPLFHAAQVACGLEPTEPVLNERACKPVVLFYGDPQTRPDAPDDYIALHDQDMRILSRSCLTADDVGGQRVAWSTAGRDLLILRTEAVSDEMYVPRYLLLPMSNADPAETERSADRVATKVAFLEFTIVQEARLLWRRVETYRRSWARWKSAIEPLRRLTVTALAFVPRLSPHDLAQIARVSALISTGFYSMRASLERLLAESRGLVQALNTDIDSTEDFVRIELDVSRIGQHKDLGSAIVDAYPYHYLKQPVAELAEQLASPLVEVESFRRLLDEIDRRRRISSETAARWVAAFLAFATVAIALPQLFPGIALDETRSGSAFLKEWNLQLPLLGSASISFQQVVSGARIVVFVSLGMLVAITIVGAIRWLLLQLARPSRTIGLVDRLLRLVETSVDSEALAIAVPDRAGNLDLLDGVACQVLDQVASQLAASNPPLWPDRLIAPMTWLIDLRDSEARDWVRRIDLALAQAKLYRFDSLRTPALPRLLVLLRYRFNIEGDPLHVLAMNTSEFRDAIERATFDGLDVDRLVLWLETPECVSAFQAIDPSGLADLLIGKGVAANRSRRTPANWSGRLGYRV